MKTKQLAIGMGLLASVLGACSTGSPGNEQTSHTGQPIVFGTPTNDPALAAVGAVIFKFARFRYHGFTCSGTLIAPQVFLTARHCVEETPLSALSVPGLNNYVAFGQDAEHAAQKVKIKSYQTAPRGPAPGLLGDGGRDVAVLYLDQVPSGIVPAKLAKFDTSTLGGQYRIAGFGYTEGYTVGEKRVGTATARALSGDWYPLLFDNDYAAFDAWYWTDSALATPSPAEETAWWAPGTYQLEPGYELLAGGLPGDSVGCYGDSGGPLFRGTTASSLTVSGVYFAGEGSFASACALGGGYTVLNDEMLAFVQGAVAAAPQMLAN
jgi:secreted trypsin-like serine protease